MAIYILKSKNSDLSGGADFNRELSADAETAGSITVTVANGATETSYGFTKPYKPSNADWETGSITVEVNVTTANTNIFLKVSASRLNSAGAVQETSSETAEQQLSTTGVKTFTIPSMNWTAGNCTDRLRINFIFRSANAHGGAINVVIETGTTNTEVTTSITENAGTCRATFVKKLRQYKPDHKTIIAEGGNTGGDGISNNIYLDSLIASRDNADKLTHKIEVELIGTAFDNVANRTAREIFYDPSSPKIRRSHSLIYDSVNKRYLLFGGWNGTTRYNDVWELSADDRFGSSPPQWRKLNPTGTPPSARTTHLAFFDAAGSRMIIHGGYDGADKNDTYALDVSTRYSEAWSTLSPTGTAPTARSQAAGAYKASSRKVYVQGGLTGASDYRNDLFELDLSTTNGAWTQLKAEDASGNPPSRADHSVVFDIGNNRLLIFGGYDGTNRLNDLWKWDIAGASFAEISDGTPPGVRHMHVAVYDENNPRMIVWGGRNGTSSSNYLSEIWELNTTAGSEAWTDRSQSAGDQVPASRSSAACFDTTNKIMVIFGGEDSSLIEHKHVYIIDLASSGSAPLYGALINNSLWGRDAMGYAYNPDRNETLIFAGYGRLVEDTIAEGEHTNEFWIYDHTNSEWYQPILNTMFGMSEREGATIIYDTNRDRYIIFGGLSGNNTTNNEYFNDVWELKASAASATGVYTLTKLNPSGTKPSARWLHAAVYDATNDRMIVFGGDDGSNFLNDVKALSFSGGADGAWSSITPTGTAPSARRQAAYAIDTGENVMLISHGGTGVNSFAGDTFKLTLTAGSEAWGSVTGTGAPSARRGMTAIYRSTDDAFYFFGGYNGTTNFDELWKLTFGASPAWSQISDTGQPGGRRSHSGTYSPTGDKMLIYGGRDDTDISFNTLNQTWEYDVAGNTWTKIDPKIYIRAGDDVTGLTSGSFHWQSWVTGTSGGDADKVSAFGNSESVADFITSVGQNFTQTLNEIVAVADLVPKQAQKVASEALLIADSLAKSANRTFAEVIAVADSISKQAQRAFAEIIAVADSLIRQGQKVMAEAVAILDSILLQATLFKTLSEAVAIADSTAKQIARSFGEIVSIADSVTAKITAKIFEETAAIADSIQWTASKTFSEAVAVIDTKILQPIKTFIESVIVADIFSIVLTIKKELSEVIAFFDSALKTIGKFMSPETMLVADSAIRLSGKNLQDTIIAADSIAKENRRIILEIVLVADASFRQGIKTFGEAVTLADNFLRTWTNQRIYDETVAVADSLLRQAQKIIRESLIITDIFFAVAVIKKELIEAVLLADAVIKNTAKTMTAEIVVIAESMARLAAKVLQDTIVAADTIFKESRRIIYEAIALADALVRQGSKTFAEAIAIADSFLRTWTAQRAFEEIIAVADSVIRQAQKLLIDAVAVSDSLAKSIQRFFSEAVAIADSLLNQTQKLFQEAVIIADSFANQLTASRTFAEVVSVADAMLKQMGRSLAEVVALADSIVRSSQKLLGEAVATIDSISNTAQRTLAEAIAIADSLAKQAMISLSESVIIADAITALKVFVRDLAEVIAAVDSIARQTGRSLAEVVSLADLATRTAGKLASEAITIADSALRNTGRVLNEAVLIADTLARQAARTLIDAVLIADILTARITAKIFDEAVIVADVIGKQTGRILNEAIAIIDSLIFQASKLLGETVAVIDAFTRTISLQRIFQEAVSIADSAIKQAQKIFGEAVLMADSASRQISRMLAEAISVADSISKTAQRMFQEAVSIADAAMKTAGKVLADIVAVVDSASKQIARTVNEIIAITDSVLKLGSRIFAETISLVDNPIRQAGKLLIDAVAIADSVTASKLQKILSEAITIADSMTVPFAKLLAEVISVADVIFRQTAKIFGEAVSIADSLNKKLLKIFADAVAVADSMTRQPAKTFQETIAIADSIIRSMTRILTQTITIADSALKKAIRLFTEALSVADSFMKLLTRYANLNEIMQIADSISRAIGKAINEVVRIAAGILNSPTFPQTLKVAIQFLTAKIGVLLSTSKQTTELKSAKKEVELKGAKQDINL